MAPGERRDSMETLVGRVTHYYSKLGVAVLKLSKEIKVGDTIAILGHTTDFIQQVTSLEIDHKKVQSGSPGARIALEVAGIVRAGDRVYRAKSRESLFDDEHLAQEDSL
jgi:hypothetical protein